jgi:hypothetical protein
MNAVLCVDQAMTHGLVLDQLEARLKHQLSGRVSDLHLEMDEGGLVLRGRTRTYYAKQLAQHALMQATDLLIVANEIEVW